MNLSDGNILISDIDICQVVSFSRYEILFHLALEALVTLFTMAGEAEKFEM